MLCSVKSVLSPWIPETSVTLVHGGNNVLALQKCVAIGSSPVNWVVSVLEQVGRPLLGQPVGVLVGGPLGRHAHEDG